MGSAKEQLGSAPGSTANSGMNTMKVLILVTGLEVETQLAITTVRVTSSGPDTGVDYYVTDLSLTGR